MELALLVYAISLLSSINAFMVLITATASIVAAIWWLGWVVSRDYKPIPATWPRRWLIAAILLSFITSLVPSEKTAYLMVGAYATQKIAEAPKTQELGADVLKIIELKIKHYSEEAEKEVLDRLAKESKTK